MSGVHVLHVSCCEMFLGEIRSQLNCCNSGIYTGDEPRPIPARSKIHSVSISGSP